MFYAAICLVYKRLRDVSEAQTMEPGKCMCGDVLRVNAQAVAQMLATGFASASEAPNRAQGNTHTQRAHAHTQVSAYETRADVLDTGLLPQAPSVVLPATGLMGRSEGPLQRAEHAPPPPVPEKTVPPSVGNVVQRGVRADAGEPLRGVSFPAPPPLAALPKEGAAPNLVGKSFVVPIQAADKPASEPVLHAPVGGVSLAEVVANPRAASATPLASSAASSLASLPEQPARVSVLSAEPVLVSAVSVGTVEHAPTPTTLSAQPAVVAAHTDHLPLEHAATAAALNPAETPHTLATTPGVSMRTPAQPAGVGGVQVPTTHGVSSSGVHSSVGSSGHMSSSAHTLHVSSLATAKEPLFNLPQGPSYTRPLSLLEKEAHQEGWITRMAKALSQHIPVLYRSRKRKAENNSEDELDLNTAEDTFNGDEAAEKRTRKKFSPALNKDGLPHTSEHSFIGG
jgi:hypothetical protein